MKLLKASLVTCGACRGRGCSRCSGRGYFVHDRSYEVADQARQRTGLTVEAETPRRTLRERQADCVCIVCESPDLATRQHCAVHAQEASDRTGARKAR